MNSKILIVFLILQIGCKQTTEPASTNMFVSFDVQSAFKNDSVKVALNNEIMLDAGVTTNYTISLAWSSGLQKLSRDNHILHFAMVEYDFQKDFNLENTYDTSTVSIRFDKSSKQINIKQIKGRVLYD